MDERSTVERAFDLAASGECRTIEEIKLRLRREQHGSIEQHLSGPSIRAQLKKLMDEAHAALAKPGDNGPGGSPLDPAAGRT